MRSSPSCDVLRDIDAIFNISPTTSQSNLPAQEWKNRTLVDHEWFDVQ